MNAAPTQTPLEQILSFLLKPFGAIGLVIGHILDVILSPFLKPAPATVGGARTLRANARVVQLPSNVTIILGLIAGALAGLLRAHVFNVFGLPADNYISVLLAVITAFVGPITGIAWRNALHLSAQVVTAISIAVTVGGVLLVQIHNNTLSAILVAALALATSLGFGPGTP